MFFCRQVLHLADGKGWVVIDLLVLQTVNIVCLERMHAIFGFARSGRACMHVHACVRSSSPVRTHSLLAQGRALPARFEYTDKTALRLERDAWSLV